MNDETMTPDERRNRDTADWLQSTIARYRHVPGRETELATMQRHLDHLAHVAVRHGWLPADKGPSGKVPSRKAVPQGQGPRERSAGDQYRSTKRRARDDFKGRHYEASLIIQDSPPLSEAMLREAVDAAWTDFEG